jgi:uncharacterized protein YgiM (DUF1202 family)
MMKLVVAGSLLLVVACGHPEVPSAPTDTREPVDVAYVNAPQLRVHAQPYDSSVVISNFESGEAVSVMAKQGEWFEIRVGDHTGWAHSGDLGNGADAKKQQADPQVRFQRFPVPISAPNVHGDIYFEADVNTDGDVTSVKILDNTTGSEVLAAQNATALQSAKLYPIVKHGERKPFKYHHHVSY